MTDDIDRLKQLLYRATPSPDADTRDDHLAKAQKNFEALQGSANKARHTPDRPKRGLMTGVMKMLGTLTSQRGLIATTALVAVSLIVFSPAGRDLLMPRDLPAAITQLPEPVTVPRSKGTALQLPENMASRESSEALAEPVLEQALTDIQQTPLRARTLSRSGPSLQSAKPARAPDQMIPLPTPNTETFANADSNPLKATVDNPVSTFSIDVDTASYAIIRSSLRAGSLPSKQAVRVEEMVNYFPYDYPAPEPDEAFRPTVSVNPTPWNTDTQIVQIGIQGALPVQTDRPPLNLVLLIDTSGSMNQPNKLPLLIQSLSLMLGELGDDDQIAIVTYAGSAGQVLAPTPASDKSTIRAALERLQAGGATAGQAGLQHAYSLADSMTEDGEIARILLATDGDFNVGISDPGALMDFVSAKRDNGAYLSVIGFGRGNLDDATMQALAQNGNGTAAYIDTLGEAQKVLVDQLSGALFPIADDVKIQVEFNPAQIAEYRLIGYETRALRREDFNNDQVDAGEIGAGHQVTAMYEVTPVGSDARLMDPLRYRTTADASATHASDEYGFLRLRYKTPGTEASQLIEVPILPDTSAATDTGFAMAIAGFGQLLRGSRYLTNWSWEDAIALATANKGPDPFGYRAEAVQLMRIAKSMSD